jgi:hypothetical protein
MINGTVVIIPSRAPLPEVRMILPGCLTVLYDENCVRPVCSLPDRAYFDGAKYPPTVRIVACGSALILISTERQLPSRWMCVEVNPST